MVYQFALSSSFNIFVLFYCRLYLKQFNGVQPPAFSYPPPLPAECYIYPTIQAPLPPGVPPMHPSALPTLAGGNVLGPDMGTSIPASSMASEEEISVPVLSSAETNGPGLLPEALFPGMKRQITDQYSSK